MGFVAGTNIKVIKQAPLKGPIEYELLGYHVSLRHSEAELIEVVTDANAHINVGDTFSSEELTAAPFSEFVKRASKTINVALVGNPNCGKTSLFNHATGRHEKVGNYICGTVCAKRASL